MVDDSLGAGVVLRAALWAQTVELVEEDDAGRRTIGSLEQLSDSFFRLADIFVQKLGTLDRNEIRLRFIGHGTGDQGLTTAGWAVQKNASWCGKSNVSEALWIEDRLDDTHLQFFPDASQSAHVLPRSVRHGGKALSLSARLHAFRRNLEVFHLDVKLRQVDLTATVFILVATAVSSVFALFLTIFECLLLSRPDHSFNGNNAGFFAKCLQVSANVAWGPFH